MQSEFAAAMAEYHMITEVCCKRLKNVNLNCSGEAYIL